MSFLTQMKTSYVGKGNITSEELYKVFEQKLGTKYKVKFEKKSGNILSKTLTGNTEDKILVSKNGYHRTYVYAKHESTNNETFFFFDEATVNGWTSFLMKQTGMIGAGIIGLCYGKGKDFYTDVVNVIKENYKPEERTVNVGLSKLWKKDSAN